MGKQIYLRKVEALFEKSPVVDFKSIARIVGNVHKDTYAKLLVHNLLKKGKIQKIGKGVYTTHNDSSLAVFAFKPAYIGLQSALSQYGIWEQETIPVIITIKQVRRGLRSIMGGNVLVRKINQRYFFGLKYILEGNFYLPYSDLEKTAIDLVVFNQKMSEETLQKIKNKMNTKKLKEYLKKYPLNIKKRVTLLFLTSTKTS